ncbi:MAG: lysophospholipid acyltransferase family protein [Hydrogenophaga sp.]|jgi:1-acyl-sn-glycerol-3-phosphate acyltransferase|uniref:1-acyl-sn-glycerol-3-phosphate acyltransferase n=1 Tax=Hydrogenophaga aromaticivorans TaxID=2610898 RepID=A0A7Y8GS37_9BURK|nr:MULTISPECIES: lysophospholipid acyltransferase family protein [Hydrogenophaga]EWS62856.1 1-acyl-sn-glycerol-3-phosphate acyltransferase [Hydrogenophaga sp. T4]MBU4180355.1 1-acyl-sn-glycerol-3-phosphate acyltransferase [Gammaproteobacteria bacterium]OGA75721.1 MAG: acyl-phosphate glycerol 3-phosphate acyltransferase [Burkholderiales bacterium GWE1_65_30]OGA90296.1 MAG: acyl-phosphate glycerol 3-phosphate acyltransferase [Burkholderiales bacterium GWF1_66_17]OGB18191.1 MAG: acyl-phosphate gl
MIVVNFLRAVLHLLFMVVTVIPWALAVVIAAPFMKPDRIYWMCARWLKLAVDGGTVILGIRNQVIGFENLPVGSTAPAVLLVKHQSLWETFSMAALMPHPLAFVFKKELLKVPFFGWAMARMDMIHIDRADGARAFAKVVQQGQRLLDQGTWVIMFPEGTRIPRGEKGTYKSGGTRLAIRTGAPVIPVAVTSAKCWPRKAFIKKPGVVEFSIGKPIPSAGRQPDELMREVEDWIETEMRRLDPTAYPAPAKD